MKKIILRGSPFAFALNVRSLPFFLLLGSNAKKGSPRAHYPKSPLGDLAARQDVRGMRLMMRLYGSGRSSPDDDELGRRLVCKLSDKETGRRQGMHEPNASWAASFHEMGVVICQESVLDLEVDGNLEGM